MNYRNFIDQHVHTDNSFDGVHNVMFLCEKAMEHGLRAVAFTDHCDIDSPSQNFRQITVPAYIEIMRARGAFMGRLIVIEGLELGQAIYDLETTERILSSLQYDFILGSIHNLRNMEDFYSLEYQPDEIDGLLRQYFSTVLELAEWDGFDSLAHLTYPLRYFCGRDKYAVDLKKHADAIDAILETLVKNGKALEINTSGLRQELKDCMPNREIVKRFRELGGEYITVGSDAHVAYDVGKGIQAGMQLAYDCGFRHVALYEHREPVLIDIE